jgi:tetratricopeptide (TPR) repeat protein
MAAKSSADDWLEDFSIVLTRDAMRRYRSDPKFEVFAGSKPLGILWLAVVSVVAGAFGGTLVSSALWQSLLQPPLWLAAVIVFCIAVRKTTLRMSGPYLAFLSGWCIGWGALIGSCALWGAQLSGSGWAYGVATGVGFLIGITHGVYEPDDFENRESFFGVSMLMGPAGACLAVWLYRNALTDPNTLGAAALAGGLAGLLFLAPAMTLLLVCLHNVEGLKRLALLLLHNDETAPEALPPLNSAIRLSPDNAELIGRRAFVYELLGRGSEAEADWARHAGLAPNSSARDLAEGWVHLRRDRPEDAATSFGKAATQHKRDKAASVGLGRIRLRLGDAHGAIAALAAIPERSLDARSLSYLAEAHLRAGDPVRAEQLATTAIDELDSIHGYSWLVRGDALRAMGDLDGAAKNYNGALWADDEAGVNEGALSRLTEIGRPVEEDEPEW